MSRARTTSTAPPTRGTIGPVESAQYVSARRSLTTDLALLAFDDEKGDDEQSPVVTPPADEVGDWYGEVTLTVTRGHASDTATDEIVLPAC